MVIRWTDHNYEDPKPPPIIRAAQYVRMSTEHQQYSTDNQAETIAMYAEKRGLEIVKTYADEGKSGLNIKGRPALRALIDDIESGRADFEVLLVYDVSRWGRFQDPDEAASYELRCRSRGVRSRAARRTDLSRQRLLVRSAVRPGIDIISRLPS